MFNFLTLDCNKTCQNECLLSLVHGSIWIFLHQQRKWNGKVAGVLRNIMYICNYCAYINARLKNKILKIKLIIIIIYTNTNTNTNTNYLLFKK